jgi:uncharacterized membrane protein YeaQ/YmgE (transglycosylase-associated protein family)
MLCGTQWKGTRTVAIVGFIVLGLIAGGIAKALHSGPAPGGLVGSLVVGVVGAVVGGIVASAFGLGAIGSFFSLGTWVIAIVGALIFLAVFSAIVDDDADHRPVSHA